MAFHHFCLKHQSDMSCFVLGWKFFPRWMNLSTWCVSFQCEDCIVRVLRFNYQHRCFIIRPVFDEIKFSNLTLWQAFLPSNSHELIRRPTPRVHPLGGLDTASHSPPRAPAAHRAPGW